MAFRGTEGAAEADLTSAFEDTDEHDVADPDGPRGGRHRSQTEEEAIEGAFGARLSHQVC